MLHSVHLVLTPDTNKDSSGARGGFGEEGRTTGSALQGVQDGWVDGSSTASGPYFRSQGSVPVERQAKRRTVVTHKMLLCVPCGD